MSILTTPPSFPTVTESSLRFRARLVGFAKEEAEEVLRAERTSDELIARLAPALEVAHLTIDALEHTWQEIKRQGAQSGMAECDLDALSRTALLVSDSTRVLLNLTDDAGEPLGTLTAHEEDRLSAIRARFEELRKSLDVPLPAPTEEDLARLARGLEEMQRGEGEYVEDVLARLRAGGER
jgi:hypothetical protein